MEKKTGQKSQDPINDIVVSSMVACWFVSRADGPNNMETPTVGGETYQRNNICFLLPKDQKRDNLENL